MHRTNQLWALLLILLLGFGCGGGGGSKKKVAADPAEPAFDAALMSTLVDNPYLPLIPGTFLVYEGETDEGSERIEIFVSHATREVLGVECTVVVDRAFVDEELVEETFDWHCQDTAGNVWYMGEASAEYEEGVLVSTDGSWEGGVDGAVPGILVKAVPIIGDSYQQEYYAGEAEDMAQVVALNVPVSLGNGLAYLCLKTREWTPLEPGVEESKYYAAGVGLVLEEQADGSEPIELAEVSVDTAVAIDPADFVALVDHPHFPLIPGDTRTFEGETEDGAARVEETVLAETKEILGVVCTVVHVLEYLDGELIEETRDWYAQDANGNVWYMGEDAKGIEGGVVVTTEGSWEAGVDGAVPGIIMKAAPRVGDTYRQEYYAGEAEDMGEVVALGFPVTLSDGTSYTCLVTRDWTPLEPDAEEFKYYAPGVGMVLEVQSDGSEPIELVSINGS